MGSGRTFHPILSIFTLSIDERFFYIFSPQVLLAIIVVVAAEFWRVDSPWPVKNPGPFRLRTPDCHGNGLLATAIPCTKLQF